MKKTILIIDDSLTSRLILNNLFSSLQTDLNILEADSAEEALQMAEKNPVDFFTLDVNMPGVTGLELLPQLRSKYPDSRIAMLTSNLSQMVIDAADENHAKCFYKPVTEDLIKNIIGYFYERSRA